MPGPSSHSIKKEIPADVQTAYNQLIMMEIHSFQISPFQYLVKEECERSNVVPTLWHLARYQI